MQSSSRGVALVVSLRILPLIWCASVSGLHCIHSDASASPFRCTEYYFDCEKCVLCIDETCSPENSRDNNCGRRGHASLPESSLNLLPFALPFSYSPGHLVSAKILSSNTINIVMIKQKKKKKPYIKLGLGADLSHRERKRPPPRRIPNVTRDLETCWTPVNRSQSKRRKCVGAFLTTMGSTKRDGIDQQYATMTTALHSRMAKAKSTG